MSEKKILPGSEIWEKLHAPLPNEAVSKHPTKSYLSSIKSIYITERLNEVFGIGGWQMEDQLIEQTEKMIITKLTLTISEYGIVMWAYGGNDNNDRGDAYKGAVTDALSKIASYIGIATEVFKGMHDTQTGASKKANGAPAVVNNKPFASDAHITGVIAKVKAGDFDLYEKTINEYNLSANQLAQLNEAKPQPVYPKNPGPVLSDLHLDNQGNSQPIVPVTGPVVPVTNTLATTEEPPKKKGRGKAKPKEEPVVLATETPNPAATPTQSVIQAGTVNMTPPGVVPKDNSIFKTAYPDAIKVKIALDQATVVAHIAELYYQNSTIIEANPELKASFTAKKNEFLNQSLG